MIKLQYKKPSKVELLKLGKRKSPISERDLIINRSNLAFKQYTGYFERASKVPGLPLLVLAEIANAQKNLREAERSFKANTDFDVRIKAIELTVENVIETALALEEKNLILKGIFLRVQKEIR